LGFVVRGGGEGEQALCDADVDTLDGSAAVQFQIELAFEGVVDGFDELAHGLEEVVAWVGCGVAVVRSQQPHAAVGEVAVQLGADVALVRDDEQCGPAGQQVGCPRRSSSLVTHREGWLPFLAPDADVAPADRQLVLRAAVSAYLGRYRGQTRLHTESDLRVFLHRRMSAIVVISL
jgi:hypothetical protein